MDILIAGYGNIGKHIYRELQKLSPDIFDPFIKEYAAGVSPGKKYAFAFICVPTDRLADGSCDTSIVEKAVRDIQADIYVIKSTVPVGTTDRLIKEYNKSIVFSPEYYGTTQHSEDSPDFLILGGDARACSEVAQLYYKVKDGSFKIRFTDTKTAELAKYMENCFLALKVTFCNEFAELAELAGVSYPELREVFVMDARMGCSHTFVYEDTPYYDSHCLNKDIPALISWAGSVGARPFLMEAMDNLNKMKKRAVIF